MNVPIIRTENLTHTYGISTPFERTAVDNVSLEISKGDFIGVIGHTGSGKSTLIQHFNALVKPTSGKIFFNGNDIWDKNFSRSALRFKVGLVFQYPEYQLFEETVEKDIGYGPKNMGLDKDEIKQRVLDSIDIVGLDEDILDKSPFELSGGQKRRVAIAGIMAINPEVLILDEPTAGLDPHGREEILEQIRNYHSKRGGTVLLVSHSMEDIAKNARKVMVMHKSQLAMYGTVDEIFSRSEELTKMGLDIPQITRIFLRLRKDGYNLRSSVYSSQQAVDEIMSYMQRNIQND